MGRTRNRKLGRKTRRGSRRFKNSRKVRKYRGGDLTNDTYNKLEKQYYNNDYEFNELSPHTKQYYNVTHEIRATPYEGPIQILKATLKSYEQIKSEEEKRKKLAKKFVNNLTSDAVTSHMSTHMSRR